MDKWCTSSEYNRSQRRTNGLQLPLNYQQISCWIVLIVTAALNIVVIVHIQYYELKVISLSLYVILYILHLVFHFMALLLDPAEKDLRRRKINDVPEFDRSVHAHVIENGRCHLCNIDTTEKTKHCGICNKCVYYFDHHCKWLNNCIGRRNYKAFIYCVLTALCIAVLTASLCITDLTFFYYYPRFLSFEAQKFINCSLSMSTHNKYCKNSIAFLSFLTILLISAITIGCALLHLVCFHVYISMLGVTTYEYITSNFTTQLYRSRCCKNPVIKCLYSVRQKTDSNETHSSGHMPPDSARENIEIPQKNSLSTNNERGITNLIYTLVNEELNRAKLTLLYDQNKIHPQENSKSQLHY